VSEFLSARQTLVSDDAPLASDLIANVKASAGGVGGLIPTPVFKSYWHLAAERQRIFFRRLRGEPPPWTADPILSAHRFTNAYRASDRVSQYLINRVICGDSVDAASTVLRVLLFKIFNRIETWEFLENAEGPITIDSFSAPRLSRLLDGRMSSGERLYSAAYIMPSPNLGVTRKHANHLLLLESLIADGTLDALTESKSLRDLYISLSGVRSFGPFLAFQFAIDLNYSDVFDFSEMDFVVAGPGARDGISKCFESSATLPAEEVIRVVADSAEEWFAEEGITFESLWGRPLQLIDCQNLFCEVSKYARVAHPDVRGASGRTRIKQRYCPTDLPVEVGYPAKWGLPITTALRSASVRDVSSSGELNSALVEIDLHDPASICLDLPPDPVPVQDGLFPLVG
jgi:hypothetical protein